MPKKWEVNQAVRSSTDLVPPRKLIMLVLSDMSEAGTAEVPARRTPSLKQLAKETGLGRSTVAEHLKGLQKEGWLRIKPNPGDRNGYQLLIPWAPDTDPVVVQEPDPKPDEVQEPDPGNQVEGSRSRTDEVQEPDTTRPAPGPPIRKNELDLPDEPSSSSAKPPRPEIERICQHLADRMIANGCKAPTIGQKWRDAARLLLDKDGRTEDQVIAAIDWATADPFWQANILSLPTLRAKYEQLRLAAVRKRERANGRASPDRDRAPATYHQRWQPEED